MGAKELFSSILSWEALRKAVMFRDKTVTYERPAPEDKWSGWSGPAGPAGPLVLGRGAFMNEDCCKKARSQTVYSVHNAFSQFPSFQTVRTCSLSCT